MTPRALLASAALAALSTSGFCEVVLEADNVGATTTGAWTASTAIAGFYGTNFTTAVVGGTADTTSFRPQRPISATGTWCAQARWTAASNRTTAARYDLYDGTAFRGTFTANQQLNGGVWRTLGCVTLTQGQTPEARLLDNSGTAGSLVVADAVRWVYEDNVSQSLCVNVAGGQSGGGGTYVARGLSTPAAGTCKPWAGFMKTGTNVVGFTAGSACTSSDNRVLTATLSTTNPSFFGTNTQVTDHLQICINGACPAGVTQFAASSYFGSSTVALVACTSSILTLPSAHN